MKENQVIQFDSKARILAKAKQYVESVETFLADQEQAVPIMLRAMKHAEPEFKREIMLVLGSFAKEEVVWPLYDIMTDPLENEEIRHDAAIQLSVIGSLIKDSQTLVERLLQQIESPDALHRLYATLAAGWRGNFQAATSLVGRLYDDDSRVQQAAVNALCNLRDERILELLVDRLKHGAADQRHSILLNLWRFDSKGDRVKEVYLDCLQHEDPDVRFDALLCLGPITDIREHVEVYRKCLRDDSEKIRELALRQLVEEAGEDVLKSLRADVEVALNDPDVQIKKAALQILKKLNN
ncbi:MAG: HEAT repeat domain-containing protein [Candidatus Binatia bacterium]